MASSDIEKKSLEAHVELCAERYNNLDQRLKSLDERMDSIERLIVEIKGAIATSSAQKPVEDSTGPYKMMLTIGTTIGGALIGALITLIVHIK
jgi:prefoldin subunit 5